MREELVVGLLRLFGVWFLGSALLLWFLGAPFWYNALGAWLLLGAWGYPKLVRWVSK